MKNKVSQFVLAIMLTCSLTVYALPTLVVEPGTGTLNAAITANQGNVIYQLKAGEWYQLTSTIQNNGFDLTIIGADPATPGGMLATLQTGASVSGAVFQQMFNSLGNLTLKNIYFVNCSLTGTVGAYFMTNGATNGRTIINKCVFNPTGTGTGFSLTGSNSKTYFTDNLVMNYGHELSPNDGFVFNTANTTGIGVDTLLVQNNTFVATGTVLHSGNLGKANIDNFSKWDHNSIILQKSQIDWQTYEREYYWTNNLMFDVNTQPWSLSWDPMPGADKGKPRSGLIYADTIANDVFPSATLQFVQYNNHYRNPKFYTQLDQINAIGKANSKPLLRYQSLLMPLDSVKVSRETEMFANSTSFPKWKNGHTLNDVDPQFVDPMIYKRSDSLVLWTLNATQVHAFGLPAANFPPASKWAKWWWYPSDGSMDLSINSDWPAFNGKYTNPALLTASIEGLPLGDLNWFPAQKAFWLAHKTEIDAHMRAANDAKMTFTALANVQSETVSFYPNPARDMIALKGVRNADFTICTLDGRVVKTAQKATILNVSDLHSGIYLITIKEGNTSSTERLMIQK